MKGQGSEVPPSVRYRCNGGRPRRGDEVVPYLKQAAQELQAAMEVAPGGAMKIPQAEAAERLGLRLQWRSPPEGR